MSATPPSHSARTVPRFSTAAVENSSWPASWATSPPNQANLRFGTVAWPVTFERLFQSIRPAGAPYGPHLPFPNGI